jgi:orotidine-5'-phosphate decarboxylase
MNAIQKLENKNKNGLHICVGLDTDLQKLPSHVKQKDDAELIFNQQIIEATKDIAAAYKINFAFYEKSGTSGLKVLEKTLELIPDDVLTIADAKRGDIGNTSAMYAKSIFDFYNFDSITINPYMGNDSVEPFLNNSEKLVFILALTSNKGSEDFQKLKLLDGTFLFQQVIKKIHSWNNLKNCGIVFGATNDMELSDNLELINDLTVLLPGIGAQGGDLNSVLKILFSKNKSNFIINVSRGILYKSSGIDFAEKARTELENYNSVVAKIKNNNRT